MPKANDDAEKQNLGTRRDGLLRQDEDDGKGVKEKGWTSWGVGKKGECLRWLNTWIGELICMQSKQSRGGSESPRRPGVPVHTATAVFLGKTRE